MYQQRKWVTAEDYMQSSRNIFDYWTAGSGASSILAKAETAWTAQPGEVSGGSYSFA